MKTLVVGMQSSGASFVTFCLAQQPDTIAVVDLYSGAVAPPLVGESRNRDVILKCTISARIPLQNQIRRFQPDRTILVTRNADAIRASLKQKHYRNQDGSIDAKVRVYRDILMRHLVWFDEIISYERFAANPPPITRTKAEVLEFNKKHSAWCRKYYRKRWGFGGLREDNARKPT